MTTKYVSSVLIVLLLGMALYAVRLNKKGENWRAALVTLPVSALFGMVLAKVLYVLLQMNYVMKRWGMSAFLRMNLTEFSFFGAVGGVLLVVLLVGKCFRISSGKLLDAFAPSLALISAGFKFSEFFLGEFGSGSYVETESHCFFPLAVKNQYDEWYYAIFMLACGSALVVLLWSLLKKENSMKLPGLLFGRVAFYIALSLVLCESLRTECMKWGFVKCEQVLSAVVIGAVMLMLCLRWKTKGVRKWLPMLGVILIVIGLVGIEFMLDKLSYPEYVGYSLMLLLLFLLALLENKTVRACCKA